MARPEVRPGAGEGADLVVTRVIYHGTGVPASDADKIFDKFFRLKGGRAGAGLGLAICKAIVEAHDATL